MDVQKTRQAMERFWSLKPEAGAPSMLNMMSEFIKIGNLSPNFDPEVHSNGLQEKCMDLMVGYTKQMIAGIKGAELHVFNCKKADGSSPDGVDRTPLIIVDVPASSAEMTGTILSYNHYDKQPHMLPWGEGLSPVEPVLKGDLLYGRGAADDGYGGPAGLMALKCVQDQGLPHCRVVFMSEFSEESGSCDLPFWIKKTADLVGTPDLVLCLDAGCLAYDTLYTCMSLRGVSIVDITIDTLSQTSIHSGIGGGVCPDVNRIFRQIMNRLEDVDTGKVLVKSMNVTPDADVMKLLEPINDMSREDFMKTFPVLDGVAVPGKNNVETLAATTWEPTITVVGYGTAAGAADQLAPVPEAGNVIRGHASVRLSCRLPPRADPDTVAKEIVELVTANPEKLGGAKIGCKVVASMAGWTAPPMAPWLSEAMSTASKDGFGKNFGAVSVGGGIPLMGMLTELFPKSQFCITGVLGPESNAHAPDEFLHMTYGRNLNVSIARLMELTSLALKK